MLCKVFKLNLQHPYSKEVKPQAPVHLAEWKIHRAAVPMMTLMVLMKPPQSCPVQSNMSEQRFHSAQLPNLNNHPPANVSPPVAGQLGATNEEYSACGDHLLPADVPVSQVSLDWSYHHCAPLMASGHSLMVLLVLWPWTCLKWVSGNRARSPTYTPGELCERDIDMSHPPQILSPT